MNKFILSISIITIFLNSILATKKALAEQKLLSKNIDIQLTLNPTPNLGKGYNSSQQDFAAQCLKSDKTVISNQFGSLNMSLQTTEFDVSSSLGIQAGGRYRTSVTDTSAAAQFARSSMNTGYTVNLIFKSEAGYNEGFESNSINIADNFKKLLDGINGRPDILNFYKSCGDEYVDSVSKSAKILAFLTVSFASEEEQQSFAAQFNFHSPVTDISASIQQASKNVSTRTSMVFNSLQLGGNANLSGQSICPNFATGNTNDNKCADPIVKCAIGQFSDCVEVLKGITKYSADSFSKQLSLADGSPQNYVITNVHVQPYYMAGAQFPLPPSDTSMKEFNQELKSLNEVFENYFSKWVLASQLANSGTPRLSSRQSNKMKLIENSLHGTVQRIAWEIDDCYANGFEACRNHVSEMQPKLDKSNQDLTKTIGAEMPTSDLIGISQAIKTLTLPETFSQYCDLADNLNQSIKTTVNTLKSFVQTTIKEEALIKALKDGDECQNYEKYLNAITDLDLSQSLTTKTEGRSENLKWQISSLGPIASLPNLVRLNISDKNIDDINELSRLKKLEYLTVDNNLISNICPLNNLTALKYLSVKNQKNQLNNINCLKKLKNLVSLDARGNGSDLTCPLKESSFCKIQDFSKTTSAFVRNEYCPFIVGAQSTLFDQQILVTGGLTPQNGFETTDKILIANQNDCLKSSSKLNIPRANHTITTLNDGRALVVGGFTDTAEFIEKGLNGITVKIVNAKMDTSRTFHTATLLPDGRVLIVGGYPEPLTVIQRISNPVKTFQIFNPKTERFEATGNLKSPRAEHTATLLKDGRVLILGGYSEGQALSSAEIIDPIQVTSTSLINSMNGGRFSHSAQLIDNQKLLIAGGLNWKSKGDNSGNQQKSLTGLDSVEVLDLVTLKFSILNDTLFVPRGGMNSYKLSDGRILFFGGNRNGTLYDLRVANTNSNAPNFYSLIGSDASMELFDPKTMGIYYLGEMTSARSQMTSAALDSDTILVLGGMGSNTSLMSMEMIIYNSIIQ